MNGINKHIIDKIKIVDKAITSNIELFDVARRGLISTNVLSQLRNLVEHVLVYGYGLKNHVNVELDWNHLNKIDEKMRVYSEYDFILKLHHLLQMSESHYTQTEDDSERLMLSYYEYLLRLKKFVKDVIGIDILSNIGDFPLDLDRTNKEYYSRIIKRIKTTNANIKIPPNHFTQLGHFFESFFIFLRAVSSILVSDKIYSTTIFTINKSIYTNFVSLSKM